MGVIALALMLAAEFGFVLWLRGTTLSQYFATRDPVAATAYYIALGFFALMPMVVGRK
jgi:type IV secretory pathway TrbD component